MIKKKKQTWLLPIVFLVGYLFAWGMILLDRQMIINEQRLLQDEVDRARIELKISKMIDEYNEDYESQVEWNIEALEELVKKEVGK